MWLLSVGVVPASNSSLAFITLKFSCGCRLFERHFRIFSVALEMHILSVSYIPYMRGAFVSLTLKSAYACDAVGSAVSFWHHYKKYL